MKIKTKYDLLTIEEKKDLKNKYYSTPRGTVVKKSLLLSKISSFFCIVWGIIVLIENIFKEHSIITYVYTILVIMFGIALLVMSHNILKKKLNYFIVKNKS